MIQRSICGFGFILLVGFASIAFGETPRTAPREGFEYRDERTFGAFTVQRWVNQAFPELSPSGMCECIGVVYAGERKVATINMEGVLMSIEIDPYSGRDINGDGSPELIVMQYSGGAHCCYSTTVYSLDQEPQSAERAVEEPQGAARQILSANTGNCNGQFTDLNGDGILEFQTCDDSWAYAFCSFADSFMPTVVFAYFPDKREYALATPHFAQRFRPTIDTLTVQAEAAMADPQRSVELDKCTVLRPFLELIYTGRFDDGVRLLRRLYRHADQAEFEKQLGERVEKSSLWVAPE